MLRPLLPLRRERVQITCPHTWRPLNPAEFRPFPGFPSPKECSVSGMRDDGRRHRFGPESGEVLFRGLQLGERFFWGTLFNIIARVLRRIALSRRPLCIPPERMGVILDLRDLSLQGKQEKLLQRIPHAERAPASAASLRSDSGHGNLTVGSALKF